MDTQDLRILYPPIEPNQTGFLEVDEGHSIYFEESGNPKGIPVLFLHGGPGLGTKPKHRSFFDPKKYRIILFDQRGSGNSQTSLPLKNNTTWDLVGDMEKLRIYLNVDKWLLFGGSWGSTLALSYAIEHPERSLGLIIMGVFLSRAKDIAWFHQAGANQMFPDLWEKFIAPIPFEEGDDILKAFYRRFTGENIKERNEVTRAWAAWGGGTYKLNPEDEPLDDELILSTYPTSLIECHYAHHKCFFDTDNWILDHAHIIEHLPCTIIHGRYDVMCPLQNAWDLHKALPESKLKIIKVAGHSSSEPAITDALIEATDSF